jgi:hypothetical protein
MNKHTRKNIKVQPRKEKLVLYRDTPVKLTREGNKFGGVLAMDKWPEQRVRKLSKDDYLVLSSGEVKQYKQNEKKQRESLAKTFKALRGIIRANFEGDAKNQKMITLTYAENMTDPEGAFVDFDRFWKKFTYANKPHKLQYVAVAEPQERGAWHMHVMTKSDQPKWWVDVDKLNKQWGHGMTSVEALKSDDMGQYYVAYFTSLADETKASKDAVSEEMSKSRQKGGRLHYYPKGMRFYRCSRGIVRPKGEIITYGQVLDEYGKPKYLHTYAVVMADDQLETEKEINAIQQQTHVREVEKNGNRDKSHNGRSDGDRS